MTFSKTVREVVFSKEETLQKRFNERHTQDVSYGSDYKNIGGPYDVFLFNKRLNLILNKP